MGKLVNVGVKYYGRTLGSELEICKHTAELYKNNPNSIDDPNSLNELWKMVEECEDTKEAADKLLEDMGCWFYKHLINFRSMLSFTLEDLRKSVRLALSTLIIRE